MSKKSLLSKQKHWFVPKKFGWGYVPVTWEGWFATLLLVVAIYITGILNGLFGAVGPGMEYTDGFRFVLDVFILIAVFHLVCKSKIKGKVTWNFGSQKKTKKRR